MPIAQLLTHTLVTIVITFGANRGHSPVRYLLNTFLLIQTTTYLLLRIIVITINLDRIKFGFQRLGLVLMVSVDVLHTKHVHNLLYLVFLQAGHREARQVGV